MGTNKSKRRTYLVLRDEIALRIANGQFKANQKLPSERILADNLNTTRLTLRDALFQLEIEGKVFRMDRRGWFVAGERLSFDLCEDKGFMTNVSQQGYSPDTKLIFCEEKTASATLAKSLKIKEGGPVYHIQRQRFINKRPVLMEDIYLDSSRYPGLQHTNLNGSLSTVLADIYGTKVSYSDIQITPIAFNSLHGKLLHVSPGTPATLITRTSYDSNDKVVEFDQEYWVSDVLSIEIRTTVS